MPIYEYKCELCGSSFEKIQKFSDPELTVCECGKNGKVARALSTPAFHLKGSGWYKTDYASSKPANGKTDAKPETKADSGESKPADSKPSESKTETKAESKPAATT
ncbi:MAG: zinc ribbon domain-containing protein [Bryobacteraceae bacterium]|nr:zinc ribbon domain-containing protein [Bryobacteraceae bacterium]